MISIRYPPLCSTNVIENEFTDQSNLTSSEGNENCKECVEHFVSFNKGLTMYDKFSESLQRVERIVMKENTLIQQVDQLKGIIINFFEVLKDHRAQMGDVNNPFCQQMITLSEQKKNDEIKANPGKANEITKEFEAEKQYWTKNIMTETTAARKKRIDDEKKRIEEEKRKKEQEIRDHQQMVNETGRLRNEKNQLEARISSLRSEENQLRSNVSSLRNEKNQLEQQRYQLQTNVTNLRNEKNQLESRINTLRSEENQLRQQIDNMRNYPPPPPHGCHPPGPPHCPHCKKIPGFQHKAETHQ